MIEPRWIVRIKAWPFCNLERIVWFVSGFNYWSYLCWYCSWKVRSEKPTTGSGLCFGSRYSSRGCPRNCICTARLVRMKNLTKLPPQTKQSYCHRYKATCTYSIKTHITGILKDISGTVTFISGQYTQPVRAEVMWFVDILKKDTHFISIK